MIPALGRFLARHRRNRYVAKFCRLVVRLHRACENFNYDFDENGERWVLERLAGCRNTKTVFDAGANIGEWSNIAAHCFTQATIHAFEVVPGTFEKLRENVGEKPKVELNNVGLSDHEGLIEIHHDPSYLALSTPVAGFSEKFHGNKPCVSTLPVTTGDAYCLAKGIDHIDFLKIDVEGHEPNVLKGFEAMLRAGAVDVIQFEYGYINIEVGFLLKDFHAYLEGFGMTLGKIYPNYVDFRKYRHAHEDFLGPNFLAVRSCHTELIKDLSGE